MLKPHWTDKNHEFLAANTALGQGHCWPEHSDKGLYVEFPLQRSLDGKFYTCDTEV